MARQSRPQSAGAAPAAASARIQVSTSTPSAQTPPRRKPERGVVKTVFLTLFFHVAALFFGVALLALLGLTIGGLGLVLLCICSGSSRTVRVLVASLWRAELWINSLGVDQAKRENAAMDAHEQFDDGRARFEDMARAAMGGSGSGSGTGSSFRSASRGGSGRSNSAHRGREVTPSVMVLSLMYFLLFKWIFNVIFSAIPLVFWIIAIGQLTSSGTDESLGVHLDISEGSGTNYFVGVAIGFLAHQISVTAAVGSVFVSEKMAGFLFEEAKREDDGTYAPLLHWSAADQNEMPSHPYQYQSAMNAQSVFDAPRPPFTASQSMPPAPPYHSPFDSRLDGQQLRLSRNASDFNRRTAALGPPTASLPDMSHAVRGAGGLRAPMPPMPPFPPFPPAMPFGARPNNVEAAYRGEAEEKIVDCCLFKVHVKRVGDNDGGGRGGRGGRGGGHGGYGGHGGRGGGHGRGGRGGGRGGSGGGRGGLRVITRDDDDFSLRVEVSARDPSSDTYPGTQASARGREGDRRRWGRSNSASGNEGGDEFAHGKTERSALKRTKSFDSLYKTATAGGDLELPPHMRMYEVLDLSPSAPPLHAGQVSFSPRRGDRFGSRTADDVPLAQLAPNQQQIPPYAMGRRDFGAPPSAAERLQMRKSNSDEGRYLDDRMARMDAKAQRAMSKKQEQQQMDQMWQHRVDEMWQQRADLMWQQRTQMLQQQSEQMRKQLEQAQRQREQADMQRRRADWQHQQLGRHPVPSGEQEQPHRTHSLPGMRSYPDVQMPHSGDVDPEAYMREREVFERERDIHHDEITQAVLEGIEKARLEEARLAAASSSGSMSRTSSTGSRTRIARPVSSAGGSSTRSIVNASSVADDTRFVPRNDQQQITYARPYQTGTSEVSDYEIRGQFDNQSHTFEEDSFLDVFRPPGDSSSETTTGLSEEQRYRGVTWLSAAAPGYNRYSPAVSPTSTSNGSFSHTPAAVYDPYSPTNSITQNDDDDDFPSDQLPQVYRSIRYNPPPSRSSPALPASARFAEFEDVPGRRDKVHFNAFAPPSVTPSPKPFRYTVWAFLLNQRSEMREKAEAFEPSGRKLTVDTKVDIRRGALVHVTLETPEGFRIVNGGATQGFPWEGKVCNATFDVQCTDGAGFGRVLFKATIIVGTEVAVMRSYVTVSSANLDPADLEAQMLESKLEVLEKTFQEIPYKSLEMKELVGKGYFGDAYRATYNGQDVVVKTIRASEFGDSNDQILQEFQHEAAVLNMFGHHPCVVPFVGASTDIRYPLSVVTKYLPYGSLEDNLRQPNAGDKFSVTQKTKMLKDAAAGLLNIHEGGFIHRDIAARNCLVDDNFRVKICDFGLCRRVSAGGGSLMKDTVGPVKYMAPESLQPPHLFSYDSDAYMFGVLMWETYTMSSPFAAMTPVEAMLKVMNGERLAVPESLPESLRSLMETCFHETPAQRPSMFEILSTLESTVSSTTSSKAASAAAAASASLSSGTHLRQDHSV